MSSLHRVLGTAVPVATLLDPAVWRERYAFRILSSETEEEPEDEISRILGCSSKRGKAKTKGGRSAAQSVVTQCAQSLKPSVIRWHLQVALSQLEILLGMPFGLVTVKGDPVDPGLTLGVDYDKREPRRPFYRSDQDNFYRFDLPAGTISIERVRAYFYDQLVWSISADDNNAGLLLFEHPGTASAHVLPTQSATLLLAWPGLASSAFGAFHLMYGMPSPLPGVWSIDYTMGTETKYGQVGLIEAALAHWVFCKAGVMLLSMEALAQTMGVQSASLSLDGLSKSVSLSPGGIFSALEERLDAATKDLDVDKLRIYKRGLRIRSTGY